MSSSPEILSLSPLETAFLRRQPKVDTTESTQPVRPLLTQLYLLMQYHYGERAAALQLSPKGNSGRFERNRQLVSAAHAGRVRELIASLPPLSSSEIQGIGQQVERVQAAQETMHRALALTGVDSFAPFSELRKCLTPPPLNFIEFCQALEKLGRDKKISPDTSLVDSLEIMSFRSQPEMTPFFSFLESRYLHIFWFVFEDLLRRASRYKATVLLESLATLATEHEISESMPLFLVEQYLNDLSHSLEKLSEQSRHRDATSAAYPPALAPR